MYAMHILTTDYFAPKTDCVRMACFQFLGCGVLSTVLSLILGESWTIPGLCARLRFRCSIAVSPKLK